MKKALITITIDNDIITTKEFAELIKHRKLSSLINGFLKNSLNIKETEISKDKFELQRKIEEMNNQKSIIEQELKKIIEKEEEEAKLYPESQGWFKHETYGWVKRGL